MTKAVPGVLLLLAGMALVGFGALRFLRDDLLAEVFAYDAAVALGLGTVALVLGILLLALPGRPEPTRAPEPAPPAQVVEIKRTEMRFGEGRESVDDSIEAQLDAVRERIGKLKVQYGLGQVSPATYKQLVAELEAEETRLERAQYESGA